MFGGFILELGTCVLAINLFCDVLALVLFLLQTTYVLWVYFVYNLWVVWSKHHATNNREYSRVHRFPALVYMQPEKQVKVQYIGIFEEIDSFYWPKMHFLKKGQKIRAWVDPPPSFGPERKEESFFSVDVFPKVTFMLSVC